MTAGAKTYDGLIGSNSKEVCRVAPMRSHVPVVKLSRRSVRSFVFIRKGPFVPPYPLTILQGSFGGISILSWTGLEAMFVALRIDMPFDSGGSRG